MPFSPNPAIVGPTGDFPSMSAAQSALQSYGLLEAGEIVEFQCQAFEDTTAALWGDDYGSDATKYIVLKALAGQEHGGVFEAGYRLKAAQSGGQIRVYAPYTQVYDLEAFTDVSVARDVWAFAANPAFTVERCIGRTVDASGVCFAVSNLDTGTGTQTRRISACIAQGSVAGGIGFEVLGFSPRWRLDNNTAVNFPGGTGYVYSGNRPSNTSLVNCVALNCGTDFNVSTNIAEILNNASGDGTEPAGGVPVSAVVEADFENYAGNDFRPASGQQLDQTGSALAEVVTAINLTPFLDPPSIGGYEIAAGAGTDVTLDWTDNSSDEDEFIIQRSDTTAEPVDWGVVPQLDTVGQNITTYNDLAVANGDHWYRVTAENASGNSGDAVADTNIEFITTPPAVGPAVLIEDLFDGAENDRVVGRTPNTSSLGSVWTISANGPNDDCYKINASAQAEQDVNSGNANWGPIIETGAADCTITADMVDRSGGGVHGIMVRTTDSSYSNANKISVDSAPLSYQEGGTIRASVNHFGNWDGALTITLNGSTVSATLDSPGGPYSFTPYTSAVDTAVTTHGMFSTRVGNIIDNFKVTEL